MVGHLTDRVDPTPVVVHAGVLALLADTCQCARAVRVNRALGPTLHIGVALQPRRTAADADIPTGPGQRPRPANTAITSSKEDSAWLSENNITDNF